MLIARRLSFFCRLLACASGAALFSFASGAVLAGDWEIRAIGTRGDYSQGSDLNNAGQLVGYSTFLNPEVFSPPSFSTFISAPNGGPASYLPGIGRASAVNAQGQIVGFDLLDRDYWEGVRTGPQGTPVMSVGGFAEMRAINDRGEFLYTAYAADDGYRVRLGRPEGDALRVADASAIALNNLSQVLLNDAGAAGAYVWTENAGLRPVLADGAFARAYDLNDRGEVLVNAGGKYFIVDAYGLPFQRLLPPAGGSIA